MSAPILTSGLGRGFPLVQGACPVCGVRGLFVGEGGYVTCSYVNCSEPDAPSRVLGA